MTRLGLSAALACSLAAQRCLAQQAPVDQERPAQAVAAQVVAPRDAADPRGAAAPPASEAQLRKWIRQLGDSSFAVREAATKRLIAAGTAATPLLEAAREDADLEVRLGSTRLAALIDQRDQERRFDAFIETGDEDLARDLVGWPQFKERIAGDRDARALFVAMHRSEPELLELDERDKGEVATVLQNRLQYEAVLISGWARLEPATQGDHLAVVAALMFVLSDPQVKLSASNTSRMVNVLMQIPISQPLGGDGLRRHPTLFLLADAWLASTFDKALGRETASNLYRAVSYAMQFNLPCGVDAAKKLLAIDSISVDYSCMAAMCIAKLGGRDDLPALAKILSGDLKLSGAPGESAANVVITTTLPTLQQLGKVQDVALAAALHLTGQNLEAYGLQNVVEDPIRLYQYQVISIPNQDERDAALAKWRKWAAANLPGEAEGDAAGDPAAE